MRKSPADACEHTNTGTWTKTASINGGQEKCEAEGCQWTDGKVSGGSCTAPGDCDSGLDAEANALGQSNQATILVCCVAIFCFFVGLYQLKIAMEERRKQKEHDAEIKRLEDEELHHAPQDAHNQDAISGSLVFSGDAPETGIHKKKEGSEKEKKEEEEEEEEEEWEEQEAEEEKQEDDQEVEGQEKNQEVGKVKIPDLTPSKWVKDAGTYSKQYPLQDHNASIYCCTSLMT